MNKDDIFVKKFFSNIRIKVFVKFRPNGDKNRPNNVKILISIDFSGILILGIIYFLYANFISICEILKGYARFLRPANKSQDLN